MQSLNNLAPFLNLIPLGLVIFFWAKNDKLWEALENKMDKDNSDNTYQRKDLCEQTVKEIKEDLKEIKADVKTLLTRGNN